MPRPAKTDTSQLLQEARAIEMLANEIDVAPQNLQEYWAIAADLVNVVSDIETLQVEQPQATYEDPGLLMLKRRLREVASRLAAVAEPD